MTIRNITIAKVIFLVSTSFFLSTLAVYSISLESIDVKAGTIWIGNAPAGSDEKDVAPHPLTTIVGVSLPIRFTSYFSFSPELRYYGQLYGIEYGRTVPVEIEFADSAFVLGLLLEPRVSFDFRIIESLTLAAHASPAFLFRIPARTWGKADRGEIAAYQYGMGRFFYPEVGFSVDWELPFRIRPEKTQSPNEGGFAEDEPGIEIHFLVDLNVYFPLFHLWDGEAQKFYDQLMVSGVVGLKFFLPQST